jgi:hypothetical protein
MQPLLDTEAAAAHVVQRGVPTSAYQLKLLRTTGGGPRFRKFGRFVRYEPAELDAWVESRLSAPRASTTQAA